MKVISWRVVVRQLSFLVVVQIRTIKAAMRCTLSLLQTVSHRSVVISDDAFPPQKSGVWSDRGTVTMAPTYQQSTASAGFVPLQMYPRVEVLPTVVLLPTHKSAHPSLTSKLACDHLQWIKPRRIERVFGAHVGNLLGGTAVLQKCIRWLRFELEEERGNRLVLEFKAEN